MGTPQFAVPSLEKICQSKHQVLAVVTAPDKPAGRGMKMQGTAIKECAVRNHIPVLQPHKLKDPDFIQELRDLDADLFVIVAFRMLPEVVWSMPAKGSINLHGSLLPKYRGAAPINWAVINGEKETGVTTFFLQHEIDTGKIILQKAFPILESDDASDVHDKMMYIGAEVLMETIDLIASNQIEGKEQVHTVDLPHAPKINKETGHIDWKISCVKIANLVRGLQPSPAAFTILDDKILKIHRATKCIVASENIAGTIRTDHKSYMHIYALDGYLDVQELQLEGKKRMKIDEFLRGNQVVDNSIITK